MLWKTLFGAGGLYGDGATRKHGYPQPDGSRQDRAKPHAVVQVVDGKGGFLL
jgi:hypothetical protein